VESNHIVISKKNESYLQFEGDLGVLMEMQEHFSFMVPGAKFHPKVRARIWDGMIKLLNMGNRTLYAGLHDKVIEFLNARQYEYAIKPNGYHGLPGELENIGPDQIEEFANSLNICSAGKPIEVRDYQIDAVVRTLQNKRILLQSPTSSGKSLILYLTIRYLLEQNPDYKFLIIVPTTSLVSQMTGDFADYSTENGWDAKENVHKITAGENKQAEKMVSIETEDGKVYRFSGNESIKLINSNITSKKAKDITEDDEIDDIWLNRNKSKQVL
jgi:adenylate kinase family enzyme